MKKILSPIFIFLILLQAFSLLLIPQKASAILKDEFKIPTIELIQAGETTLKIKYNFAVNTADDGVIAHDIYKADLATTNKYDAVGGQDGNIIFEIFSDVSGDDEASLGSYDQLECNGYGCGVYLDITSDKTALENMDAEATVPSNDEILSGDVLKRAGTVISDTDPEAKKQKQTIVIIPNLLGSPEQSHVITITGLAPETAYYLQGRMEEKSSWIGTSNATLSAVSDDPAKIQQWSTLKAGSGEVDSPTAGQQDYSGETSGSNPLGGGEELYCWRTETGIAGIPTGFDVNWGGCLAEILQTVFFKGTAAFVVLSAHLLDWTVAYSIDSTSYNASTFVQNAWALVRDLSNMFFIFLLLYIAIATILNLNGINWKKAVSTLILVGLFINFSLFFSKVIIDASNILAHVFYNQITVTGEKVTPLGEEKAISFALATHFQPQTLFTKSGINPNEHIWTYIMVIFLATFVNIVMIFVFLSVMFIFFGRIVGLMISMIIAPLAFTSHIVPGGSSWKVIGWKSWFGSLINQAFVAPVFIFFIWLIISFLQVPQLQFNPNAGVEVKVIAFIVPFILVYYLLMKAKNIATDMSEEAGKVANKFGRWAGGRAVGFTSGTLGFALSRTIGRGANNAAKNQELQARAASGDGWARMQLNAYNALGSSTFDFRKTKAGDALTKEAKWNMSTANTAKAVQGTGNFIMGPGRVDLSNEGGVKGAIDRKKEARMKEAELYKTTGYNADQQNTRAKEWQGQYETDRDNAQAYAESHGERFSEADFRKTYEQGVATLYDNQGQVITDRINAEGENVSHGIAKIQNAAETNAERMRDAADTLEYGGAYVENRNRARQETAEVIAREIANGTPPNKRTAAFVERDWRRDNEITPQTMSGSQRETVSGLRKQAGEENKDASKPLTGAQRRKTEAQLSLANREIQEINDHLGEIARTLHEDLGGPDLQPAQITQNEIRTVVTAREADLRNAQTSLAQAEISGNAGQMAQARMDVKSIEEQIKTYKTLFNEQDKVRQKQQEAMDKLGS